MHRSSILIDSKILTVEIRLGTSSWLSPIDDGDGAADRASLKFLASELVELWNIPDGVSLPS